MAKKLEFEKEQARQRILKQGSEISYEGNMTDREKDAWRDGRERELKRAKERSQADRNALLNNPPTPSKEEAARQLDGLKSILAAMSERERITQGDWIGKQILRLESQLAERRVIKGNIRKK
jgi:hypothetical protein